LCSGLSAVSNLLFNANNILTDKRGKLQKKKSMKNELQEALFNLSEVKRKMGIVSIPLLPPLYFSEGVGV